MKKILPLLFIFVPFIFQAQKVNVDSLTKVWNNTSLHDTVRMKAMDKILVSYVKKNPDTTFRLAQILREFAIKAHNINFEAKAVNAQGYAKYMSNDPPGAIELFKENIALRKKEGNKKGAANALGNLGTVFNSTSRHLEAIEVTKEALALHKELKDRDGQLVNYNSLGNIYQGLGQYLEAVDNFETAFRLSLELDNKMMQAYITVNLGNNYFLRKEFSLALKQFFKGKAMMEKLNDKKNLSNALQGLGLVYQDLKNYDSAGYYVKKAMILREEINDKVSLAASLVSLGKISMLKRNLAEGKKYFENALDMYIKLGMREGSLANIYLDLAGAYFEQKNYGEAKRYTDLATDQSERSGSLDSKVSVYEIQYNIAKAQGDFKNGLMWHEKFMRGRDSLLGEENQKALTKQQFRHEYERKAAADSLKVEEGKKITELQFRQERTNRNFLIAGIIFLVCGLVFAINRFAVTQKQKKIIETQKDIVEAKQQEILDSIHYAKRIQRSLLPSDKYINRILEESGKPDKKI